MNVHLHVWITRVRVRERYCKSNEATEWYFLLVAFLLRKGSSNFWFRGWNPKVRLFKKDNEKNLTMVLLAGVAWRFLSASKQAQAGEGSEAARRLGREQRETFRVCDWNPVVWPFNWKLLSSTFPWCSCLSWCTRWLLLLSLSMESLSVTFYWSTINSLQLKVFKSMLWSFFQKRQK